MAVGADQYVAGLHVAVNQTIAVGEGERSGYVGGYFGGPVGLQWTIGPEDLSEAPSVDVLHDDEVRALLLAPVEDTHHIGMIQVGRRLGLASKPLHKIGISGEFVEQDLDSHRTIQKEIAREKDIGHTSPSDLSLELVPPVEDGGTL